MVRVDLVHDKVRRLRATLAALAGCLPADPAALGASRDARDLASFRVYLSMQEAIDLCSHLIADEGWGPAPSLRDHFTILADKGVIDAGLAGHLAAGVKIRNLIGHAYVEIDPVRLHAAALELQQLLEAFCAQVLAFAGSAEGTR
jgi:uncharacterized protein YutE (UPF0331/DUF86 family)